MNGEGNRYELIELDNGVTSFRHINNGEILHGSVGPEKEARELYLAHSGLMESDSEEQVVFDVGLGCAAQLLALLDFMDSGSSRCRALKIFSFDLEKDGLRAILEHSHLFPSARRHKEFLTECLDGDFLSKTLSNGNRVEWHFCAGDFRDSIVSLARTHPQLKADAIFYDFFSPASHPWLWTMNLFESVLKFARPRTRFITHSSATCVKAALAAAGWFVGHSIASGKKARSVIAAGAPEILQDPLGAAFLLTFERSHKAYCDAESAQDRRVIAERLRSHPQFKCRISTSETR